MEYFARALLFLSFPKLFCHGVESLIFWITQPQLSKYWCCLLFDLYINSSRFEGPQTINSLHLDTMFDLTYILVEFYSPGYSRPLAQPLPLGPLSPNPISCLIILPVSLVFRPETLNWPVSWSYFDKECPSRWNIERRERDGSLNRWHKAESAF